MTNSLSLAAVHSAYPAPLTIVLVIAAVGYVLWSRMQGRPLKVRRLVVLPVVLAVLGINDLTGSSAPQLTPKDVGFLVVGVTISALLGAARGATIEIYPNGGELWQRYRKSTVGLWIALIVAKVVLLAIAHSAGASAGGGTNSLLLSLGVSLLAEAAIVGPRAMSTGLPFADRRQAPSGRFPSARPVDIVTQPAPTLNEPVRDNRAPWSPPPQAFDDYRSYGRHNHNHRGPIHRLLGADGPRQRRNGN